MVSDLFFLHQLYTLFVLQVVVKVNCVIANLIWTCYKIHMIYDISQIL